MTEDLYNKKLGDIINEDMLNGLMKAPNKLVKITFTYQDVEGTQMDCSLKHKDYIENDQEE